MPREQRTNLKKTEVEKTELGIFASKPSGAVEMPLVQAVKSKGQALAEGVGLVAKGAAKIFGDIAEERKDKEALRNKLTQELAGNHQGDMAGIVAAEKISNLIVDGKPATSKQKHLALLEEAANLNFTDDMSVHFYRSYYKALMRPLDALEKKWRKTAAADKANEAVELNSKLALGSIYDGDMTGNQIISVMRQSKAWLNKDRLPAYVDLVVSNGKMLHNLALESPDLHTFDKEAYFKKYLHIKVGEGSPGGPLDLRASPPTGDKIRKFRTYLNSTENSTYAKNKSLAKSRLELGHTDNMEPSQYAKLVKNAEDLGYINQYDAEKRNVLRGNAWDKHIAKESIQLSKAEVKAATAELGELEVGEETEANLVRYAKSSQALVGLGVKTQEQHNADVKKLRKDVEDDLDFLSFTSNFYIKGDNNNHDYEIWTPDKKKHAREQVRYWLNDEYQRLQTPGINSSAVYAEILKISLANTTVSKGFISSLMPMTEDYKKAKEGLKQLEAFRNIPGGESIVTLLPQGQRALYQVLNVVKGELPGAELSEIEFKAAIDMTKKGEHTDYGKKISDRRKTLKKLGTALNGLPDNLQTELAILFDYHSQTMSDPKKAAALVKKNAEDWYKSDINVVTEEGNLTNILKKGEPAFDTDVKVSLINGMASPIKFGMSGDARDSQLAKILLEKLEKANGTPINSDKVRIAWDDDRKEWSIALIEGPNDPVTPFYIISHDKLYNKK